MGNYTISWMFENPRRGRQARNFITNVPKILDLKSFSEQIFSEILINFVISTYLLPSLQPQKKVDKLHKYCLEDFGIQGR